MFSKSFERFEILNSAIGFHGNTRFYLFRFILIIVILNVNIDRIIFTLKKE